jgi:hypothetical protein
VLPIIFFAVVFGIALSYIKDASNRSWPRRAPPRGRGERRAESMYKLVSG